MELQTLIKRIEHDELTPTKSSDTIQFYCKPSLRGRIPEPHSVQQHVADDIKNYPYQQTLGVNNRLPEPTEQTTELHKEGWLLPFPSDLLIRNPENKPAYPVAGDSMQRTGFITNYRDEYSITNDRSIAQISTLWHVTVPDGYSILYTKPVIGENNHMTIIPGLIDGDEFPARIDVPVIIDNEHFRVQSGDPFVTVYPINRDIIDQPLITDTIQEQGIKTISD